MTDQIIDHSSEDIQAQLERLGLYYADVGGLRISAEGETDSFTFCVLDENEFIQEEARDLPAREAAGRVQWATLEAQGVNVKARQIMNALSHWEICEEEAGEKMNALHGSNYEDANTYPATIDDCQGDLFVIFDAPPEDGDPEFSAFDTDTGVEFTENHNRAAISIMLWNRAHAYPENRL